MGQSHCSSQLHSHWWTDAVARYDSFHWFHQSRMFLPGTIWAIGSLFLCFSAYVFNIFWNLAKACVFLHAVLLTCMALLAKICATGSRSLLFFGVCGEKLVRIVVVVPVLEDVNDCCGEASNLFRRDSCSFDSIHRSCIDFG